MNRFQKWLFLAGFIFISFGCQRDDICPEGTDTTSLLVIEFYDPLDPTRLKAVSNLTVRASGMEEVLVESSTVNTVSIPLRTNENFTEYIFTVNSGSDEENSDTVTFTYSPDPEYLNRACGYKVNFNSLDVAIHDDEDNWILSETIIQESVENETEAHIYFTH
ncbi:hypothetical protein JRG66_13610 [Salinimicrobium tongyeongense]|uniref:Uncharacterized protein n=1 Tax=Salinimicrobium tongyeongense TaxID=2809707 RepID=A0ABY6NPZ5_9FLAO|nr:DUF6452 family protein [Salinimicrobium tongyeongense]UZH54981.1 hypothetical protein JRG66_13610 [Salinimicrobium tongyeongense]